MRGVSLIEFWPEYGGAGPLWSPDGTSLDLDALPLTPGLRDRLRRWNSDYDDEKLPTGGSGDADWLGEGRRLLSEVRQALDGVDVVVHEDWWAEPGEPFRQPSPRRSAVRFSARTGNRYVEGLAGELNPRVETKRMSGLAEQKKFTPLAASWIATALLTGILLASVAIALARNVSDAKVFVAAAWSVAFGCVTGLRFERQRRD
jgi:hypothetical protein